MGAELALVTLGTEALLAGGAGAAVFVNTRDGGVCCGRSDRMSLSTVTAAAATGVESDELGVRIWCDCKKNDSERSRDDRTARAAA